MMTPEQARVGRKAVDALIEMLPPSGSVFPVEERKQWLDAMAATLRLIYGTEGEIKTTVDGDEVHVKAIDGKRKDEKE